MTEPRCGLIAIVGRPNVGKSTLLNAVLGQKLSITSRKPQTTRYQVQGVVTRGESQVVLVDTPGWQRHPRNELNRRMNKQVQHALDTVDHAVLVQDARGWNADDQLVLERLKHEALPVTLVLNKEDRCGDKKNLLPLIAAAAQRHAFSAIVPTCARTGAGVPDLLEHIARQLPARAHIYPHDQVTNLSERFFAAELIREKTLRYLGDELPYRSSVLIDEFIDEDTLTRILATIWVERDSHKSIVIGTQGEVLKRISTDARHDLEQLLERRVFLRIWVKTRRGWSDNQEALAALGLGG